MATIARHRVDVVTHPGWFTPPPAVAVLPHVAAGVRGPRRHQQRGGEQVARVGAGDPGSGLQGEFGVGYALFGLLQAAFMLGLLIGAPAFKRGGEDLGIRSSSSGSASPAGRSPPRVRDGDDVRGVLRLPRLRRPRRGVLLCARGAVHRRRRASRAQDALAGDVLPLHPARGGWRRDVRGAVARARKARTRWGGAGRSASRPSRWRPWRSSAWRPGRFPCAAWTSAPRVFEAAAARRVATRRRRMTSRRSRRKLCWRTTFRRGSGTRFQERDTRRRTRGQISRRYSQSAIHGGLVDQRSRRISRLCAATARFWWPSPGHVPRHRDDWRVRGVGAQGGFGVYASDLETPSRSDVVLGGITVVAGVAGTIAAASPPTRRAPTRAPRFASAPSPDSSRRVPGAGVLGGHVRGVRGALLPRAGVRVRRAGAGERRRAAVGAREREPLACSLVTVIIHALGDVPTPPLFGLALEASAGGAGGAPTPANWRAVLGGFTALMAVAPPRRGPRGRWRARRAKTRAVSPRASAGSPGGACEPRRVFGTRGNDRGRRVRRVFCPPRGRPGLRVRVGAVFVRRRGGKRAPRSGAARASERDDRRGEDERENEKTSRTRNDAPRRTLRNHQTFQEHPDAPRVVKRISKKKNGGRADAGHCVARSASAARPRAAAEMATLPYVTVDAFTTVKFRGEPRRGGRVPQGKHRGCWI